MTKSELKRKTVEYLLTQPAGMRLTMMDAVTTACSGEAVDSSLLTYTLLDDIIEGCKLLGAVDDIAYEDRRFVIEDCNLRGGGAWVDREDSHEGFMGLMGLIGPMGLMSYMAARASE